MVPYAIAGRDGTRLTGLMTEEDAKALEALPKPIWESSLSALNAAFSFLLSF